MESETTWATTTTASPLADLKAVREASEKLINFNKPSPVALPHPLLGTIIVETDILETFMSDLFREVGLYGFLGISLRGFVLRFMRSGLPFTRFATYAPYPLTPPAQTPVADHRRIPASPAPSAGA